MKKTKKTSAVDLLVVSAHPDDAEITSGGLLLSLKKQGKQIVLADMTHGEAGTRGTGETRDREAKAAAKFLGAERRVLDFPDSELHETEGITEAIIQLIREYKPALLLAPYPKDLHPDHQKVGECAQAAFFLAGVKKRSPGLAAFRPKRLFHYMSHYRFTPSFLFDVSNLWEEKLELIQCYESQLRPVDSKDKGEHLPSLTNIRERIELRDRYFGHMMGTRFAEPYFVEGPLRVENLFSV